MFDFHFRPFILRCPLSAIQVPIENLSVYIDLVIIDMIAIALGKSFGFRKYFSSYLLLYHSQILRLFKWLSRKCCHWTWNCQTHYYKFSTYRNHLQLDNYQYVSIVYKGSMPRFWIDQSTSTPGTHHQCAKIIRIFFISYISLYESKVERY